METFYFFIPLAVVAAMGLIQDGQTVSREVRVSDLLTDGSISVSEYLALASARVVFMPVPIFTFQSVAQAAGGWVCSQLEPEPLAWGHTRGLLNSLFPGGHEGTRPLEEGVVFYNSPQEWLPCPPEADGRAVQVSVLDVLEHLPDEEGEDHYLFLFAEGQVVLEKTTQRQWVTMLLWGGYHTQWASYFVDPDARYCQWSSC
jgi:hypothetical protein